MRTVGSQMRTMSIDDLTERIKIVYHERTRNERGDIVKCEERVRAECRAKILPRGAKRYVEVGIEVFNEISYGVTIRYRNDIAPDDEIIWRGRRLQLTQPPFDVEAQRMWLTMEAKEVKADDASRT